MYSSHDSHISVLEKKAKETNSIWVCYINSSQMYVIMYNYSRIIFHSHLVLPDRYLAVI